MAHVSINIACPTKSISRTETVILGVAGYDDVKHLVREWDILHPLLYGKNAYYVAGYTAQEGVIAYAAFDVRDGELQARSVFVRPSFRAQGLVQRMLEFVSRIHSVDRVNGNSVHSLLKHVKGRSP